MKERLLECLILYSYDSDQENEKNISVKCTLPLGIDLWASPSLMACGWGGTPGSCEPGLRWSFCAVLSQQLWAQHPLQPLIVLTLSQQTRKWHVTSSCICFLHTLPPHRTFSSFSSFGAWGELRSFDYNPLGLCGVFVMRIADFWRVSLWNV